MMKNKIISKIELVFVVIGVLLISAMVVYLYSGNEVFKQYSLFVTVSLNIIVTLAIWLGCRIIVKFLWIKYPWEKHPLKHLIIETVTIPIWAVTVMSISGYIYNQVSSMPLPEQQDSFGVVFGIIITLLITSIHESVYFYKQWKENFNLSLKLKKDNLEARYETLKAQLNPHFLFNSLNTLISYLYDNPKATDYVLNLSDFLRCVLKNQDKQVITLREELETCEMYLFLQNSRFGSNLEWKIDLPDELLDTYVAPLSIQMLLENAIKHNIISKENKLIIAIGQEKRDYLYVSNNLQKKLSENSTGIGIKNIMDRYDYLSINKPQIIEETGVYKVLLPIIYKTL
jgi:two-component system, LytTR family, sensor kinase